MPKSTVRRTPLDHDVCGSYRSTDMNVIDFRMTEPDVCRKPRRTLRHHALAVVTTLGFGLGLTDHALAHAHLKSATPAAGSTVAAAPSELDLKFSEGLNLKFTGVKVTGPAKAAVATGDAALGSGDDTTLIVPVSDTLAAGSYTVVWHALSTDGHKTNGSYKFTVKP